VTAAQRAFDADTNRRIHGPQSSKTSKSRPVLSEINLNRLPPPPPPPARPPPVIPSSSIYSSYYGGSRHAFDDGEEGEEYYEPTVVHRRASVRCHRETLTGTPAPSDRQEPRNLVTPEPEFDIFISQDYEPPHDGSSTPSSYRHIKKAKSAFAVSHMFVPPPALAIPSVAFGAGGPPAKENQRKSASFLRGGTDFMGEGRARERRSYYMESNARKTLPPIVPPEIVAGIYKGKDEKDERGTMRFRKKAKKITDSVFGSMRRVLGRSCSGIDQASSVSIPEQQVASSRLHFREYVAAEEPLSPRKSGAKEKPKIRSNYVVSKAPSLHVITSQEMIHSDVGSIRNATPPTPQNSERKFSGRSMGTISTATWSSSIASRMSGQTVRDNGDPAGGEEFFQPPPRRERFNVDARRVYSALLKRQNSVDKSAPTGAMEGSGYYMIPGIGLLPEEERIFERHVAPSTKTASIRSNSSKLTVKPELVGRSEPEFGQGSPPPPVPKIPKIWTANSVELNTHNEDTGAIRNRKSWAPSSTTLYAPINRDLRPEPLHAELDHGDDAISTSTDAALSACHLQVLKTRRFQTGTSHENLRGSPLATKRLSHLEAGENIRRSRSVLEQRHTNNRTPVERTRTPGYDRPPRAGLRNIDINAAPIAGSEMSPLNLTKSDSRTSLSGRVSRLSMREFDVGLAVTRQFGPVNSGYPNYNNHHLYRGYANNNGRRTSARVDDDGDDEEDRAFL